MPHYYGYQWQNHAMVIDIFYLQFLAVIHVITVFKLFLYKIAIKYMQMYIPLGMVAQSNKNVKYVYITIQP